MCLFAQSGIVTGVIFAGSALAVALLLLRWHRYFRKQPKNEPSIVQLPRPKPKGLARNLDAPEEFTEWEVEMHEVARDLSGQLDSKMSALQSLIREADQASDRLKAILAAGARTAGYELPSGLFEAESSRPPGARNLSEGGPFSAFGKGKREPSAEQDTQVEQRYQQICTLADQGFSADQIAAEVGIPVGEVMLILGLRGKG